MKRIIKMQIPAYITTAIITLIVTAISAFAFQSEAYMRRMDELIDMGLSDEQIFDQLAEEFSGSNVGAGFGTGGIDGKYLDGTIAPNGILAGTSGGSSSGGGSTTSTPSHSHSYDDGVVTKNATCTSAGEMTYTCSCGKTKTSTLPMLDHDISHLIGSTTGTCTELGTITYKCKTCDKAETITTTYADHIYIKSVEDSLDASCTEDGLKVSYCSVCGGKTEEVLPAHGHSKLDTPRVITHPTCTEEGAEEYYCGYCNVVMDSKTLPANGHGKGVWTITKEPGYLEDGEQTLICEVCSVVLESKVLDKVNIPVYLYVVSGVAVVAIAGTGALVIAKKKK